MMETREVYLTEYEERMPAVRVGSIVPVTRARQVAQDLARIVRECRLSLRIGNTEYVRYEGWQIMCALLGVGLPTIIEVERIALDNDAYAYRAVAEFELMGRVYRAESRCDSTERNWQGKPEYAVMAMAQTRASGRVMRMCLGWIMPLAGYSGTPAEEVIDAEVRPAPPPEPQPRRRARQQSEAQANGNQELDEWRTRVAQKWAELHPLPEGVSRQERAQLLRERHQRLLEFAQLQYPDINDVKQLTVEQLQHLASLMDVDEFLKETS